ncbi:zinc finger protein 501-like [Anopheles maculipalpis]|uniref:zinc finger protein 501-like n=1 Tax=Anopheles maculipalpis TaxID=1496333 RepID=UPI002158E5A9|nr:zinc finger protein 501-like [Anopheles maculipalpis]
MSQKVQEMWNICRFCLSQEEDLLAPIATILDSYLTVENVERFTGVTIELHDRVQQAVCVYCTYRLQESIAFLSACTRNDVYLRKLCRLEDKACTPASNMLNECDGQDPLEVKEGQMSKKVFENPSNLKKKEKKGIVEPKEPVIDTPSTAAVRPANTQPMSNTTNKEDFVQTVEKFYSANYIEPGETSTDSETDECESDEESSSPSTSNNRNGKRAKFAAPPKQRICFTTKEGINLFALSMNEHKKALCDICGKMVVHIPSHIPTHTKETKHACPHCPVRMTHKANLMRHINAVHLKIIIKTCELCGKGFSHKNTYLSHMRAHHGIGKMQECKVCSKTFSHPSGLRTHFERAHGSQLYKCVTCSMCFKMKKSLEVHQRVHSSDKPYACRECPKRFKSPRARRNHELTHKGVLFKCTICDKSYRYKSLLNMHLRKVHTSDNDGGE